MEQMKQKYKRIAKYWRVAYKQSSGRDRLIVGAFALMALAYMWWAMLTF